MPAHAFADQEQDHRADGGDRHVQRVVDGDDRVRSAVQQRDHGHQRGHRHQEHKVLPAGEHGGRHDRQRHERRQRPGQSLRRVVTHATQGDEQAQQECAECRCDRHAVVAHEQQAGDEHQRQRRQQADATHRLRLLGVVDHAVPPPEPGERQRGDHREGAQQGQQAPLLPVVVGRGQSGAGAPELPPCIGGTPESRPARPLRHVHLRVGPARQAQSHASPRLAYPRRGAQAGRSNSRRSASAAVETRSRRPSPSKPSADPAGRSIPSTRARPCATCSQ